MLQQTLVWTAVCLGALGLCLWRPELGRIVLGVFFLVMAIGVNLVFVLVSPEGFVKLGTDAPLVPLYEWFFRRVVAVAPAAFGLLTAAFEVTVGLLLIQGGRGADAGLIGAIVFLAVISPLGPWTLPNLIMAAALGVVLWRRRRARGRPGGETP